MRGLVIDEPWISAILAGKKTWEMRKGACNVRERIGLIRKGSGEVVGVAQIVDCLVPIETLEEYARSQRFHAIPPERQARAFDEGWRTPWVLRDTRALAEPVTYRHNSGAVIWVTLEEKVEAAVAREAERSAAAALAAQSVAQAPPVAADSQSVPEPEMCIGARKTGTRVGSQARRTSGTRARIEGRIEGDRCIIPISDGNIKNHHVYLRSVLPFFPTDCVGGCDETQIAPRSVTLVFEGGPTISTDIAGPDKLGREERSAHYFFRNARGGVIRPFFERLRAEPGDEVVIRRSSPYAYTIGLQKLARA
jgi:ASCH domain